MVMLVFLIFTLYSQQLIEKILHNLE